MRKEKVPGLAMVVNGKFCRDFFLSVNFTLWIAWKIYLLISNSRAECRKLAKKKFFWLSYLANILIYTYLEREL